MRTFDGAAPAAAEAAAGGGRGGGGGGGGGRGGGGGPARWRRWRAGLNSVTWDLRYPERDVVPGHDPLGRRRRPGPAAPPGTYQVRMTVDGQTQTQPLVVKRHPLYKDVTDADLQAQFDLAIQIRDKTSEANKAVIDIRDMKTQVADRLTKTHDARLKAAGDKLTEEPQRRRGGDLPGEEPERAGSAQLPDQDEQPPRVAAVDGRTTATASRSATRRSSFKDLVEELKVETDKLEETLVGELATFNTEVKRLGLDPVVKK